MTSNLSSIGFVFESADHARRLIAELAGYAVHRTATLPGDYAIWRSGGGAEIWYHVEGERSFFGRMDGGRVVGFRPFFAGEGKLPVRIENLVQRPGGTAFEGLFVGEAEAGYKIAFEAMDYAVHELRTLPITAVAHLVGFAHSITTFRSETAFIAACDDDDMLVRAFYGDKRIGFGSADNDNAPKAVNREMQHDLTHQENDGARYGAYGHQNTDGTLAAARVFLPTTAGVLRGLVLKYRLIENEVTSRHYHWCLVDGPGGTFDVVADQALLSEPLAEGMVIETTATFSGQLPGPK